MATQSERQALIFVAALAALGVAARGFRARSEPSLAAVASLDRQIASVDSATAARSRKGGPARPRPGAAARRPPATRTENREPRLPPARVDLDTAGPDELTSIPGIGPVLAARIVEDRARRGPFGSLANLQRVKGIGPVLAGRIDRFVTFSRSSRSP